MAKRTYPKRRKTGAAKPAEDGKTPSGEKKVAGVKKAKTQATGPKVAKSGGGVAAGAGGAVKTAGKTGPAAGKGKTTARTAGGAKGKTVSASAQAKDKALKVKQAVRKGTITTRRRKIRTNITFRMPKTLKQTRKPKFPRISVPRRPRMDKFAIIDHPITTESAMKKIEEHNTLVFLVHLKASKPQVKQAVESMYDVQVAKVNTLVRPDGFKKAYVRLLPDYDALDVANKIGII
ncbi:hypothetical protein RvY_15407 [Ramazzottius varieornatus]|uniref:Large ribosomal subunit protein uL23 N-terminal domain-containing protein n=1 Tax=Ramazzottius varieornatus TaxID=947166 RepID=A0A1D1W1L7_RAMVA|nr:hypothetical protein RvY_15407 [Ramazzottius varieornatus]